MKFFSANLDNLRKLYIDQLQQLHSVETQITDAGLVHLLGLSKLRWLGLCWTKVTDTGAKKLQAALPNAFIYHESMPSSDRAKKAS